MSLRRIDEKEIRYVQTILISIKFLYAPYSLGYVAPNGNKKLQLGFFAFTQLNSFKLLFPRSEFAPMSNLVEILPNSSKYGQIFPSPAESCQILPIVANSRKIAPNLAKYRQDLSNLG